MSTVQIYQTFHKSFINNHQSNWLKPIGVNGFKEVNFLSDSSGENISSLNPYFCELTVQYWAWKNTQIDWIGFCHYRRYFIFNHKIHSLNSGRYFYKLAEQSNENLENLVDFLSNNDQLKSLLTLIDKFDVIVPCCDLLFPSISGQYLACVEREPWDEFIKLLKLTYFNHAKIDDYFNLEHRAPMCNMFVMKRELFDCYCNELFFILDLVYRKLGNKYDHYNNRYPGFLAERFLGFWIMMRNLKICEIPTVFIS